MNGLLSAALLLIFSCPAVALGEGKPAINEVCAQLDDVISSTITAPAIDISSWLIKVKPSGVFGTGHGGAGADDIDRPDGLAFTRDGLLLATDGVNKRIKVLDVVKGKIIGEFGRGVIKGDVVNIAVADDGRVLITDEKLGIAYPFRSLGGASFKSEGGPLFAGEGFKKLGGAAFDSQGRTYLVDAVLNEVRRYLRDGSADPSWHFEKARADGTCLLNATEGIVIDEPAGIVYVANEEDSTIQLFDYKTGRYRNALIGRGLDPGSRRPTGRSLFKGSVEGLAILHGYLLAVDEAGGKIHLFDLKEPGVVNQDLDKLTGREGKGYIGYLGQGSKVDLELPKNSGLKARVKAGKVNMNKYNPPNYLCSPDSVAAYYEGAGGESYIALADQLNYRVAIYRWSEVAKARGLRSWE